MHGAGRAPGRRVTMPHGRARAAVLAGAAAVITVAVYAIVTLTGASGTAGGATPEAGASHAGPLLLDDTGAALAAWRSPATCTAHGYTPDGDVTTDSGGDIVLTTTGGGNSCAALASPATYAAAVIEAQIDLPADPGRAGTVANWDAFWLTDPARWPHDGELDAVETEPPTGANAVSWHSGTGTTTASYNLSTTTGTLPVHGPDLTPGWHTIDIVYTRGYFAVYYDRALYTSLTSPLVTGDPLTIYFTTDVYPQASNADSQPATLKLRYLKIWSYK